MRVLLNFLVELLNACLCLLSCSGLYIHVILGLGVSEAQHFPTHTFFFSLFFFFNLQHKQGLLEVVQISLINKI